MKIVSTPERLANQSVWFARGDHHLSSFGDSQGTLRHHRDRGVGAGQLSPKVRGKGDN